MFENQIFEKWLDQKSTEIVSKVDKRFEQVDGRFDRLSEYMMWQTALVVGFLSLITYKIF